MKSRLAVLVASALLLALPHRSVAQYSENFNSGIPAGWVGSGTFGTWNGALYLDGTSTMYSPFFTMGAPGTLELFAQFLTPDVMPWNDYATVRLWNGATWQQLFFASVATGSTDWTRLSADIGPGTYQLAFNVNNALDDYVDSHLLIDDINAALPPPVMVTPEPASLVLMATGLLGVIGVSIRTRNRQK
jgi:hypothetical protein